MKLVKTKPLWGLSVLFILEILTATNAAANPAGNAVTAAPPTTVVASAAASPPPEQPAPQPNHASVAPSCGNPCTHENASDATRYAIQLVKEGKIGDALIYIDSCQQICPIYSCQLSAIYDKSDDLLLQKYVANRKIRHITSQCREFALIEAGAVVGDPTSMRMDQVTMDMVNKIWRKAHRPIWAGYALLGIGAVVSVTSAVLMGVAANNQLPLSGDCGQQSGIRGDPCIADFSKPGTKAALGIPLAAGLGSMFTGAVLLLTF